MLTQINLTKWWVKKPLSEDYLHYDSINIKKCEPKQKTFKGHIHMWLNYKEKQGWK